MSLRKLIEDSGLLLPEDKCELNSRTGLLLAAELVIGRMPKHLLPNQQVVAVVIPVIYHTPNDEHKFAVVELPTNSWVPVPENVEHLLSDFQGTTMELNPVTPLRITRTHTLQEAAQFAQAVWAKLTF